MLSRLAVILAATTMAVPALASEPVLLHAAGSLRTALTEVTGTFEAASGQRVQAKYGPSGTLKDGRSERVPAWVKPHVGLMSAFAPLVGAKRTSISVVDL
jgi:hypothetical protein